MLKRQKGMVTMSSRLTSHVNLSTAVASCEGRGPINKSQREKEKDMGRRSKASKNLADKNRDYFVGGANVAPTAWGHQESIVVYVYAYVYKLPNYVI